MPTEKPRITFAISKEKLEELEAYRFENRIKNQTQAILALIEKGLADFEADAKEVPLYTDGAMRLARDYDGLDGHGKRVLRLVADEEKARCIERARSVREDEPPEIIYFNLPQYHQRMSAGSGQPAGDEWGENLLLTKRPPQGASYVATISGDSMEPTYHDGDRLFIQAAINIQIGQVGVFLMDGQQWVKELGDGVLISHNPAYLPRPMAEDVRCQGLVLGVCDDSYFT